jgi:hypothetical protein
MNQDRGLRCGVMLAATDYAVCEKAANHGPFGRSRRSLDAAQERERHLLTTDGHQHGPMKVRQEIGLRFTLDIKSQDFQHQMRF